MTNAAAAPRATVGGRNGGSGMVQTSSRQRWAIFAAAALMQLPPVEVATLASQLHLCRSRQLPLAEDFDSYGNDNGSRSESVFFDSIPSDLSSS